MTNQFKEFISVIKALNGYKVDYIVIGGVAVIFYGMERLTRDIDIFIKSEPQNIINLRKALYSLYNDRSIEEITFEEMKKYPVIRYGTPKGFYIDLMTSIGEKAVFDDLKFQEVKFEDVIIRIATPETLYELKKDTLRLKDKIDALFLKEQFINKKQTD